MTGPVLFCDEAPEVTERSGLFVVEIGSGDQRVSYALILRAISILAKRSVEAVNLLTLQRRAAVVPFPPPKPKRKRGSAPASSRGEGC